MPPRLDLGDDLLDCQAIARHRCVQASEDLVGDLQLLHHVPRGCPKLTSTFDDQLALDSPTPPQTRRAVAWPQAGELKRILGGETDVPAGRAGALAGVQIDSGKPAGMGCRISATDRGAQVLSGHSVIVSHQYTLHRPLSTRASSSGPNRDPSNCTIRVPTEP